MTEDEAVTYINKCLQKASDESYEALTEIEKVIYLASSTDFEILSGGLTGFYYNSAGDMVIDAADALRDIGAANASEAVIQSAHLFADFSRISQRDYRQDVIPELTDKFRDLESLYDQQSPSVWELLVSYVGITNLA